MGKGRRGRSGPWTVLGLLRLDHIGVGWRYPENQDRRRERRTCCWHVSEAPAVQDGAQRPSPRSRARREAPSVGFQEPQKQPLLTALAVRGYVWAAWRCPGCAELDSKAGTLPRLTWSPPLWAANPLP